MAYNQPAHGGAADSYYQEGQQNIAMQQQPYQQPGPGPQYQQQTQGQYPPPAGPPPQQQYTQQPPDYGNGKGPNYGSGENMGFQQTFKVDKPKFNDLWAAILFFLTCAGFVAVSVLSLRGYASTSSQQGGGIYGSANDVSLNSNTIVLFAFVLAVAFVISLAYFWIIRAFTKQAIWITGILQIVFGIGTAIVYFARHWYSAGIVFLIFSVFYIICFISWIPRIPFSVLMLQTVIDVSKNYGHIFIVSLIGGFAATAFAAYFSVTMVAVYAKYYPGSPGCDASGGSCSKGKVIGLLVFITFAGYWITEVIKNVIHVSISGVYGSWYFCSQKPGGFPKGATRGAFKRAATYSFGSISFGSLIVAIIQLLRQACSIAQQNEAAQGNLLGEIFFCCLQCFIGLLDWAVQFINEYAFSYIALYGKAYIPAAKTTWTMMKDRGVDALVNECLINPVLTMGAVFVAYSCSLLAYLYITFTKPAYNEGDAFTAVVMAFAFLIGLQICNIFLVPIKSGVATFFVAMAFDPQVLIQEFPDLWQRLSNFTHFPIFLCYITYGPLTITTSIVGLLKATALVAHYLGPYAKAAKDTPKIAIQVHSEVVHLRTILLALEGLTKNLEAIPVKRVALIQIDQLVAVFTDGVLLFSELETCLPSPPSTNTNNARIPLRSRLQWARKESTLAALLTRLQGFKGSISLILTILQSDSDLRAMQHQHELSGNVAALLESNQSLSRRLMHLENALDVSTIVSERHSSAFTTTNKTGYDISTPSEGVVASSFEFEDDLENSRVYRRAQRDTMDFSFRSSIAHTNAWSVFSGLSLSDISIISAIALPLYPDEILNAQHYRFRDLQEIPASAHAPNIVQRSLYQQCLEVELHLSQIPGFLEIFRMARDDCIVEDEDPLTLLIQAFRRDLSFLTLLEQFPQLEKFTHPIRERYDVILEGKYFLDMNKLIMSCLEYLGFQPNACFSESDLIGNDTTGFTKVLKVIIKLLDMLTTSGILKPIDLMALLPEEERRLTKPSSRDIMLENFLVDERSYMADLSRLLELKKKIDMYDGFNDSVLSRISTPLYSMVDMQRQFLLKLEMIARTPLERQNWATNFKFWSNMWPTYANFIAREREAQNYIRNYLAKQQRVEDDDLNSALKDSLPLLYIPSAHLQKYRYFLEVFEDLLYALSDPQLSDIQASRVAFGNFVHYIEDLVQEKMLEDARAQLVARVENWKNMNLESFGKLLLFDMNVPIIGNSKNSAVYHVYLFEKILLVCKEISPIRKFTTRDLVFRRAKNLEADPVNILQLKGRIFATNIIKSISILKPGLGTYHCQIHWRGDPAIENFTMKFQTESRMETWCQEIERLRKLNVL